ncbi:uncharacterized protein N7498_007779 [Penicillium cinerascens]|uniref:Rhodopsin domain-containing protein n=1 Tax=Penicillium cinerascens TaxID=70096 RepID=A0A9W9JLK2_9EURO|nr:uncharacterized protein N7498_007779 [Penicillium cinerascens]KAJ5198662.1 hypothetical protein N7498_007779 [Penicillium cinerascens]
MESAAPYAISVRDQTGSIVIVETLFMSWMILVTLIRLYLRLAINGPLQIDDLIVFIGSVMAVAHTGTIMGAISHGLGRSQDESMLSDLKQAGKTGKCMDYKTDGDWVQGVYAANLFFLAGHGAAKISTCLLLQRLGRQKHYLLCSKILLGAVVVWTVTSMLAIATSCLPQYQFMMPQHCGNVGTAWKAITAFDIITEIFTFGMSILLVWGIQMQRKEKGAVIFAFGTRTLCVPDIAKEQDLKWILISFVIFRLIIITIIRQVFLDRSLFHHDAPLRLSDSIIATAALLHCSIMMATVPCLKPFVISFNTGWGQGVKNRNGENTYFTPAGKSTSAIRSQAYTTNQGEEDEANLTVTRHSRDSQNSHRLIIHQRREWTVEEDYEMHSLGDGI